MVILDIQKQHTTLYTRDEHGLHKQSFFGDLSELSTLYTPTDEEITILLSESYCHLRTYTMGVTAYTPFTIWEYKALLAEKDRLFLTETKVSPEIQQHLLYSEEGIRQQTLAAYLGQTGQIDLHRCIYAPYTHIMLDLERARGHMHHRRPLVSIRPRLMYALENLHYRLGKKDFLLLSVNETSTDICNVKNGRYHAFLQAPIGHQILVQAAEEQQVQKYLFGEFDQIEKNQVVKKLLYEAISFFVTQLMRLVRAQANNSLVALHTHLVHHPLFMSIIQEQMKYYPNVFIVPSTITPLPHITYTRHDSDLAVWGYLANEYDSTRKAFDI